jgi:hypothetical protein
MPADVPNTVCEDVLAHIEAAGVAVGRQDFDGMASSLDRAIAIYEAHPSHVHDERSELGGLLTFIRCAQSLCRALGMPGKQLRELEARANALPATLH